MDRNHLMLSHNDSKSNPLEKIAYSPSFLLVLIVVLKSHMLADIAELESCDDSINVR